MAETAEMKVKALAPWFGGKRTMAPTIVQELGKHTQYFEPFCGSMAVLFAKDPVQKETVNDLHQDLINLARVLADPKLAKDLYDRLSRGLFSEDLLETARSRLQEARAVRPSKEAKSGQCWYCGEPAREVWGGGETPALFCRKCAAFGRASIRLRALGCAAEADELDEAYGIETRPSFSNWTFPSDDGEECAPSVTRAFWYFLASWMGRNGTAGTARVDYQIAVRWTKNGGSPTVRWRNAVESIPEWHRRLQGVVILRRDAFRIIDRFEDVKETAIYVDPPYAGETRGKIKDGRSGVYLHEFNHEPSLLESDQHAKLAEILRRYRKARVVVSYYDCPRIRELYDGWTFVEHTRQKHLHAQNGRGARPKEAPEVLIINGPSYAG